MKSLILVYFWMFFVLIGLFLRLPVMFRSSRTCLDYSWPAGMRLVTIPKTRHLLGRCRLRSVLKAAIAEQPNAVFALGCNACQETYCNVTQSIE